MQCMISKSNVKFTDSNVKFTDSEVRMANQFASSTQQEIEKLLEDKDSMILSLEMHLAFQDGENLFITQLYIFKCLKINCDHFDNAFVVIFFKTMYNKTIIILVFVISVIIKISVSVMSLSLEFRLITLKAGFQHFHWRRSRNRSCNQKR